MFSLQKFDFFLLVNEIKFGKFYTESKSVPDVVP